jgi:hypothetical protein
MLYNVIRGSTMCRINHSQATQFCGFRRQHVKNMLRHRSKTNTTMATQARPSQMNRSFLARMPFTGLCATATRLEV